MCSLCSQRHSLSSYLPGTFVTSNQRPQFPTLLSRLLDLWFSSLVRNFLSPQFPTSCVSDTPPPPPPPHLEHFLHQRSPTRETLSHRGPTPFLRHNTPLVPLFSVGCAFTYNLSSRETSFYPRLPRTWPPSK